MKTYDLIIVGGGILGLSHAFHALRMKKSVLLLEKNNQAIGASVRNFGQIVPSGFGEKWQEIGRKSLQHYMEIQQQAEIFIRREGSIYIASDEEESMLLEELHVINKNRNYPSVLMTKAEILHKYPTLVPEYVQNGLFFPDEIHADSRKTIPALSSYLQFQGMEARYNRTISDIHATNKEVILFDNYGDKWIGDQVVVCNGDEFSLLFPEIFEESDIEVVKLQMMETVPQAAGIKIPGSVLTGWTIRRYESFSECPSFADIKKKENRNDFQHEKGVHILFKQTGEGTVIIGDSHEYADVLNRDNLRPHEMNEEINWFLYEAANQIMELDYSILRLWNGIYSQCKNKEIFNHTIDGRIHIATAIGGKGMTGSLGWAEDHIKSIFIH
jgi:FAD dependent oxidoreductase TIGR03364